jgi:hypothetical protein
MIDYRWITGYWPDSGFTVTVAALLNMKAASGGAFAKPNMYKVLYSLLLPGLFYRELPMTDQAEFTLQYDMTSTHTNPRFVDPATLYTHVKQEAAQCLIIDVRSMRIDGKVTSTS